MKILTRKQMDGLRARGYRAGVEKPALIMVAGGDERVRCSFMQHVVSPGGDRGRVHRIVHPRDLQGIRGGVLLCTHGTPADVEREALRRGITVVDVSYR